IGSDASFAKELGLDPQQARIFRTAADGPVGSEGGNQAKARILQGLDDGATEAQGRVDRLKADIQRIADDLNAAQDPATFDQAVDRAVKATSAQEQARATEEARKAYQERAMKAAADELQAEADRIRAAAADTIPGRQQPAPTPTPQPAPAATLGEANLR